MSSKGPKITVDEVRQQNAKILQLIDLPKLLPLLKERETFTEEILKKVSDTQHHSQFERSNFLLSYLYQKGQTAVDVFIECIRKAESPNHDEILRLLEGDLVDPQTQSPLFSILETQLNSIVKCIHLVGLLKALLSLKAIPLNSFLDLQNTDRTVRETLNRLFLLLEKQGSRGFISFMAALQKDLPNPKHEQLSEILFAEVNRFFREHPQRDQVSQSDRIELQQLEQRERVIGHQIHSRINQHRETLTAQLNVPAVLPPLVRHQVITRDDADFLGQLDPASQADQLLSLMLDKEHSSLLKFSECLKETEINREAGELLLPSLNASPQTQQSAIQKPVESGERYDKLAVFICADNYFSPNGSSNGLEPKLFDSPLKEHRETLKKQLQSLNFHVLNFDTNIDNDQLSNNSPKTSKAKRITERFISEVADKCMDKAIVFLFLSGIQFPMKVGCGEFSGAVLRTNASNYGRLPLDSIECSDLTEWVGEMGGANVTIVVDTEQSHVVSFDKTRTVSEVEILEWAWPGLVSSESSTVVLYLKPSPEAIGASRGPRGRGIGSPLGMLTETLTKALVPCVLKNKELLSHRSLYDAISFYWHCSESGPLHTHFVPAMAGDMDRCFLERTSLPYQQTFRAILSRDTSGKQLFVNSITVAAGTMAGLIQSDQLEVFHVLRPGLRVEGRVTDSYSLHCEATVDQDGWRQLLRSLTELYKEGELMGTKPAFEFLLVRKKYPLHLKLGVYPKELDRDSTNNLKTYIKDHSNLLSYVPQEASADVVVGFEDRLFIVQEGGAENHVKYPVTRSSIERVKSVLEIMAWFKYVIKNLLRSHRVQKQGLYECSLMAAHPLLSSAAPRCREFELARSSCVGASPVSLGYEAILRFTDPPEFWVPAKRDPSPYLKVIFKRNHIISSIEIRGDPTWHTHVEQVSLVHSKTMLQASVRPPVDRLEGGNDLIQYITLRPMMEANAHFSITLKLKARRPKTKSGYLEQVWLHSPWPLPSDWPLNPICDQKGLIMLDKSPHTITWSGVGQGAELTLNLGTPTLLERMELPDLLEVKELNVSLDSSQYTFQTSAFATSAYPKKFHFPRPIVASRITILPLRLSDNSRMQQIALNPNASDIRLQLQLHGNTHGELLDVDEGELLNFQLNSLSDKELYFCILCLEETGAITQVNEKEEKAPAMYEQDGQSVYPSTKLLVQTEIPKGYNPKAGHIKDMYWVLVSPGPLYVSPFLQPGVHTLHEPISYDICMLGHRNGPMTDEWFDDIYTVRVKKR